MRREVGQVGDGDSFQDWFNNIPPITKVNEQKVVNSLFPDHTNYYM